MRFNESSGAITVAAFGECRDRRFELIVGACASTDPTYNRPGELVYLGGTETALTGYVLDAHKKFRPNGDGILANQSLSSPCSTEVNSEGCLL